MKEIHKLGLFVLHHAFLNGRIMGDACTLSDKTIHFQAFGEISSQRVIALDKESTESDLIWPVN